MRRKLNIFKFFRSSKGMTLMEILITVSLITMISVAIYNALSNGLRVWDRSQQLVTEESVVIFFDKLTQDLRNTIIYSAFHFEGTNREIKIPTLLLTLQSRGDDDDDSRLVEQIGQVEYFYDSLRQIIYRRQNSYGKALNKEKGVDRALVEDVEDIEFNYVYITDSGELKSDKALATIPWGVEVKVDFLDNKVKRTITKYIEIPVGS